MLRFSLKHCIKFSPCCLINHLIKNSTLFLTQAFIKILSDNRKTYMLLCKNSLILTCLVELPTHKIYDMLQFFLSRLIFLYVILYNLLQRRINNLTFRVQVLSDKINNLNYFVLLKILITNQALEY